MNNFCQDSVQLRIRRNKVKSMPEMHQEVINLLKKTLPFFNLLKTRRFPVKILYHFLQMVGVKHAESLGTIVFGNYI